MTTASKANPPTQTTPGEPPKTDASKTPRDPRQTPAMRQFTRFKSQHPECVLFFRMGDFYEMFYEDARLAHKVLGITLTQRSEGVPMAGVPYHAVEGYLRRMVEAGYRVAVCDQIQDPKEAKGVVDRAVTRVVTPGTLVDENLLDEAAANRLAAIQFTESGERSAAVLAVVELSTGTFAVHDLPAERVGDELARIAPNELLYVETADGAAPPRIDAVRAMLDCAITARPAWTFRISDAADIMRQHFHVASFTGFGLAEDDPAIGPAGALLRYLQETQATDRAEAADGRLQHLRPPKRESPDASVVIDAASLRSLEIERTMRSGSTEGSLLSCLQRCRTAMGKRLLREWLCFPVRDLSVITARQDAVSDLLADRDNAAALANQMDGVQDVARIVGRMATGRTTPRDLVALGRSVERLASLLELIDQRPALTPLADRLKQLAEPLAPLAQSIGQRCVDSPPAHLREGGLFRDGIDAELDEARLLQKDANTWLAEYQARLTTETAIPSLKVGYNKVFGYYIEITHAHTAKVPDAFSRKQTLKNAERYVTPELKEFEDKVTTARSRALEREKTLFERLCASAARQAQPLGQYADLVAELDVLAGFADTAVRHKFVRPTVVNEPVLDIRGGRHPVLDQTLRDRFVPNDCALGEVECETITPDDEESDSSHDAADVNDDATLALITGPNMAGKSTYIRQTALIVLLAHTGGFVPADSAVIGLTDRIFTRIGASDEIHAGQSTFMVEMTETANILHHATDRSLVILDEIGRGTSTLDGLSLAWAIVETLAARRCRTLFATHYHELTALGDRIDNVTNLHVAVREWGEKIIFIYRILPGRTDRSYGIHVAQLAGLPREAIARAAQVLDTLTVQTDAPRIPDSGSGPASTSYERRSSAQMSLFTEYLEHPVVGELRALDLDAMSPLEAFDHLRRLRQSVDGSRSDGDTPL